MGKRARKLPPVVSKEQLERERKLTSTCAMGMKMTLASNDCWRHQVQGEARIRNEWQRVFEPDWPEKEAASLARVEAQEAQRRQERDLNPHWPLLMDGVSKDGKGRRQYLAARHTIPPNEKQLGPLTTTQAIGWEASHMGGSDSPLATKRGLFQPVFSPQLTQALAVAKLQSTEHQLLGSGSAKAASTTKANTATATQQHRPGMRERPVDPLASIQSITYDRHGRCSMVGNGAE